MVTFKEKYSQIMIYFYHMHSCRLYKIFFNLIFSFRIENVFQRIISFKYFSNFVDMILMNFRFNISELKEYIIAFLRT